MYDLHLNSCTEYPSWMFTMMTLLQHYHVCVNGRIYLIYFLEEIFSDVAVVSYEDVL